MRICMPVWSVCAVVLLSSCVQDPVSPDDGRSGAFTLVANLDGGVPSRASGADENAGIDRYVLEVYVDGKQDKDASLSTTNTTGIFNLQLSLEHDYQFYCWADEGDDSAYDVSGGLSRITLKADRVPTIAHRGEYSVSANIQPDNNASMSMQHVVGKAVLRTETPLAANSSRMVLDTYVGYDAVNNVVTGGKKTVVSAFGPSAAITSASVPADVTEVYILTFKEVGDVTVHYTVLPGDFSDACTYSKSITNVPFAPDCRSVLTGDIAGLQYSTAQIRATLDLDWTDAGDDVLSIGGQDKPDDPDDSYTAIDMSGKSLAAISSAIEAAVNAGNKEIRLLGPVQQGLFGANGLFISDKSGVTAIDLSRTTGWESLNYTLESQTFEACGGLTAVVLPETVRVIGDKAFSASGLVQISLPGVTSLGDCCFQLCSSLCEVDAPKVTTMGKDVFQAYVKTLRTLKLTAGKLSFSGGSSNATFNGCQTSECDLWLSQAMLSEMDGDNPLMLKGAGKGQAWKSVTFVDENGSVVSQ